MSTVQGTGQVLLFRGGGFIRRTEALPPRGSGHAGPRTEGARAQERQQAVEAVQGALSAALMADTALCRLRLQQALSLCAGRPHAAWAARQEVQRALAVDIVARHLRACDRRRRLHREIEALALRLHLIAAPAAA